MGGGPAAGAAGDSKLAAPPGRDKHLLSSLTKREGPAGPLIGGGRAN
jgi:hypothetical protein